VKARTAPPFQKSQCHHAVRPAGWITPDDLTGDIERMIHAVVVPYVDESNPLMHEDELQAECRARLAYILDGNYLVKCPTRAKAFHCHPTGN
jgi:hypothetical protein